MIDDAELRLMLVVMYIQKIYSKDDPKAKIKMYLCFATIIKATKLKNKCNWGTSYKLYNPILEII